MIATRKDHEVEVLIWNYHDDDLPAAATPIDLVISGLPAKTSHGLLEHFRIDSSHSNAFTAWKEMGSPQSPTAEQYEQLQRAGQLQLAHFSGVDADRARRHASAICFAPAGAFARPNRVGVSSGRTVGGFSRAAVT